MKIKKIQAQEVLDSRGNPTLAVTVILSNGSRGVAKVPSGASTGAHEVLELRDNDEKRYGGKGVLKAVRNVEEVIFPALKNKDASQQEKLDEQMIALDGTKNKSNIGANAILGVSLALACASAYAKKIPLYQYLRSLFGLKSKKYLMPLPMMNILNGGKHADSGIDVQEYMIVPWGAKNMAEAVRFGSETFFALKEILKSKGYSTTVGDEGGFAPQLETNRQPLEEAMAAIDKAGYEAGRDIALALDFAASEFYDEEKKEYFLKLEKAALSSKRMIALIREWADKFPLIIIEDPLSQDDWPAWKKITEILGKKLQIVGDDFFVTNIERLKRGLKEKCANAILIKPNQIGTLTETLAAIHLAQKNHYGVVISHRSGETADTFIADLAVATNAGQIKTGSLSRSERVEKYNRLMQIERELGKKAELNTKI